MQEGQRPVRARWESAHPRIRATLWGGLAFLAYGPLREMAAATPAWRAVGKWAMAQLG